MDPKDINIDGFLLRYRTARAFGKYVESRPLHARGDLIRRLLEVPIEVHLQLSPNLTIVKKQWVSKQDFVIEINSRTILKTTKGILKFKRLAKQEDIDVSKAALPHFEYALDVSLELVFRSNKDTITSAFANAELNPLGKTKSVLESMPLNKQYKSADLISMCSTLLKQHMNSFNAQVQSIQQNLKSLDQITIIENALQVFPKGTDFEYNEKSIFTVLIDDEILIRIFPMDINNNGQTWYTTRDSPTRLLLDDIYNKAARTTIGSKPLTFQPIKGVRPWKALLPKVKTFDEAIKDLKRN